MHRRASAMILMIGLILTTALIAGQSQPAKKKQVQQSPDTYVIQGVLVDRAKTPIAGRRVYLFRMSQGSGLVSLPGGAQAIQNSVSVSMKSDNDGKIVNPSAETDATGRFTIKTDIQFMRKWQIATDSLVAAIMDKTSTILTKPDGSPATLSLEAQKTIDLGTVQPEARQ